VKRWPVGLLLAGLILAGTLGVRAQDKLSQAPNFTLPDLNGKKVALKSLLGKGPVFVHFWATWCVPCQEEMAYLEKIYENYKDKGLVIVAISNDDPKTVNKVKPFIKGRRYKFLVLLDTSQEVSNLYHVQDVMPTDYLIDAKGRVHKVYSGYHAGDEVTIEKDIVTLMSEPKL
jgi:cytochrome c biogenesis protein CcmG/thiol:disulfide interchange protein DsbE